MSSYVVGSTCWWSRAATSRFPAGLWVDITEGGERKNNYEDEKKVWHLRFRGQQNWGKVVNVGSISWIYNSLHYNEIYRDSVPEWSVNGKKRLLAHSIAILNIPILWRLSFPFVINIICKQKSPPPPPPPAFPKQYKKKLLFFQPGSPPLQDKKKNPPPPPFRANTTFE